LEILYRKGSATEIDAFSRRPERFHHAIAAAELLLDIYLEDMRNFLFSLFPFQVDDSLLHKIRS
jgi:hypothetical protein